MLLLKHKRLLILNAIRGKGTLQFPLKLSLLLTPISKSV